MSGWEPIATAPRDGEEVLVYVRHAETDIIRNARWSDGDLWELHGAESQDEERGWWYYVHSVSQDRFPDWMQPTHWMPIPELPGDDDPHAD